MFSHTFFSLHKMSFIPWKLPDLMDSAAWRCLRDLLGHGAKSAVWAMAAGSCETLRSCSLRLFSSNSENLFARSCLALIHHLIVWGKSCVSLNRKQLLSYFSWTSTQHVFLASHYQKEEIVILAIPSLLPKFWERLKKFDGWMRLLLSRLITFQPCPWQILYL